jgi:hypothetical protein
MGGAVSYLLLELLKVCLVSVAGLGMGVARARRGVDGALALLELGWWHLGGVCSRQSTVSTRSCGGHSLGKRALPYPTLCSCDELCLRVVERGLLCQRRLLLPPRCLQPCRRQRGRCHRVDLQRDLRTRGT